MKPVKFNDTSKYEFIEALGVEGAFTSQRIERDTLPEGFYKYSFREGETEMLGAVSDEVIADHAGDFITKKPLDLGPEGTKDLGAGDWRWSQRNFDFEAFFGQKLSIDCQIANADAKRLAQMGEGREGPAHGRSDAPKHAGPGI